MPAELQDTNHLLYTNVAYGSNDLLNRDMILFGTASLYRARIKLSDNSGVVQSYGSRSPMQVETYFDENRQFIKLEQTFLTELNRYLNVNDKVTELKYKEKMKSSLNRILKLKPISISLQVTYDNSVFYTFSKDQYTIYFEHFLEDEDETDEAIMTIFMGDDICMKYGGTLSKTFNKLAEFIRSNSSTEEALQVLYDISF